MSDQVFTPPNTIEELFDKLSGNAFSSINKPTSGARTEMALPRGDTSFQLYSLGTPNGHKAAIILEELGVPYDAHVINIMKGEQFTSGFVHVNPNSKIPAAIDYDGPDGEAVCLFESSSIMLYLAEKYGKFLPNNSVKKVEMYNWLFFQSSGQGAMTGVSF